MTEYYSETELVSAKKQKNRVLTFYFIILGVYLIATVACFIYYGTLPYSGYKNTSEKIKWLKFAHYSLTAVFAVFSVIYLGIKYKRIKKYYITCAHISTGIRETSTGSFLEYDETLQDKDGVDFKSLIFLEWNKYKKDFFERKVLVFYEKPFPEIPEQANVTYVTQSNVLVSYEILS